MDSEFLQEVYIKQFIRDEGVRRDQLSSPEKTDDLEEYLFLNNWNGNNVVKLNRNGRETIKPKIRETAREIIDKVQLESNYEYSELIKYILSEMNNIEAERDNIHDGILMNETDWIDYYLRRPDIWKELVSYLKELEKERIVYRTKNYVSTNSGELRGEHYCWPKEVSERFDSPDLGAAKNKVLVYRFVWDCVSQQEGVESGEDPSKSEKRQKFFELLEEAPLTKEEIEGAIENLPKGLIEIEEEVLYPKKTGRKLKHELKQRIIANNKDLLKRNRPAGRILTLIEGGEGEQIEFKEQLGYDGDQRTIKGGFDGMKGDILKEICAFANKNGGKILVGVSDNGEISGLPIESSKDEDNIIEELEDAIESKIGSNFVHTVKFRFKEVDEEKILIVEVDKGESPTYLNKEGKERLYVRSKRSSRPYSLQEAVEYITNKWDY